MAESPPHPPTPTHSPRQGGGGLGASLQRKLGPLPLYAWVVVVVAGYFLWRHFHGSSSQALNVSTPASSTDATSIPLGDQSGGGGTGSGSAGVGDQTPGPPGATQSPTDTAQASGGGTSSGAPTTAAPAYSRPVYLGPATTAVAAAQQAQVSTTTSGRPTKVGGLYHPGQRFD